MRKDSADQFSSEVSHSIAGAYIRLFYQMRNLTESLETVARVQE
jgi:hypothetical protein